MLSVLFFVTFSAVKNIRNFFPFVGTVLTEVNTQKAMIREFFAHCCLFALRNVFVKILCLVHNMMIILIKDF